MKRNLQIVVWMEISVSAFFAGNISKSSYHGNIWYLHVIFYIGTANQRKIPLISSMTGKGYHFFCSFYILLKNMNGQTKFAYMIMCTVDQHFNIWRCYQSAFCGYTHSLKQILKEIRIFPNILSCLKFVSPSMLWKFSIHAVCPRS